MEQGERSAISVALSETHPEVSISEARLPPRLQRPVVIFLTSGAL